MSRQRVKYGATKEPVLSEQVRAWRLQSGLTQSQLEQRAGLSHNTVSRIERDEVSPRIETVERLAAAMELGVEELTFRQPSSVVREESASYGKDDLGRLVDRLGMLPEAKREKLMRVMSDLLDLAEVE